jgi:hypothetical protein
MAIRQQSAEIGGDRQGQCWRQSSGVTPPIEGLPPWAAPVVKLSGGSGTQVGADSIQPSDPFLSLKAIQRRVDNRLGMRDQLPPAPTRLRRLPLGTVREQILARALQVV